MLSVSSSMNASKYPLQTNKTKKPTRPDPTLLLPQFLSELLWKRPASIHAQIHGCRQCHEGRRILRACHVLYTHLHCWFATFPHFSHRRRHHKPSIQLKQCCRPEFEPGSGSGSRSSSGSVPWPGSKIPTSSWGVHCSDTRGFVNTEFPPILGAESPRGDLGGGVGTREEVEAVANGVGAAVLPPRLEAAPRVTRHIPMAKNEPHPGAWLADPPRGPGGRHKPCDHWGYRHHWTRQVVYAYLPSLSMFTTCWITLFTA